jgi:hypothetical protein
MGSGKRKLAKLFSIPVLAIAGFLVAASIAGVGGATGTTVGLQGCTPGYWKTDQHLDSWVGTGYSPTQTVESVFDVPDSFGLDNVTLRAALSLQGGNTLAGKAEILLRAGVAALLNAGSPNVDYPLTTAQVISQVNTALNSGSASAMTTAASSLDAKNNLGCPLN